MADIPVTIFRASTVRTGTQPSNPAEVEGEVFPPVNPPGTDPVFVDILGQPLTGYTVGSNTALAATDTILGAFEKVQGQINARVSGTIASGQVAVGSGVDTISGSSDFTWNGTRLQLKNLGGTQILDLENKNTLGDVYVGFLNNGVRVGFFGFPSSVSNTFIIANETANSMRFRTSGLDRLTIASTGIVGILTTAPTNTLDVNGTARIRTISNLGVAATSVLVPDATGVVSLRTLAEFVSDASPSFDARYLRKNANDSSSFRYTFNPVLSSGERAIQINPSGGGSAIWVGYSSTRIFEISNNAVTIANVDSFSVTKNFVSGLRLLTLIDTEPTSGNFGAYLRCVSGFSGEVLLIDREGTINLKGISFSYGGGNIVTDTTTGTKIATATTQKLGFWNATPIVQPTTAVTEATFVENAGGTAINVDSTFDGYTLQQVVKALRNTGLLA